ncbi:MAG: tetratricopeptide repeat protein [Gammaproteobacteria bacterium]
MALFAELKRRNVFRAAAAYVAVTWLIVQVAETTFPAFGLSDAALRNLILLLGAGFIPAVALAWVFELTPEGLKRDKDLEPGSDLSLRTNRILDRGIVAVLALGIAYFAIDKFLLDPARDAEKIEQARKAGRTEAIVQSYGEKSIAVLPFTNMSADPEQEYFGDGMAEEILNLLAQVAELRVISRSSAFTFKDSDLKLSEIAEELDVAHILEGSVRKAGSTLRITAQLIEARSDTHLWSKTWDRDLADIFAIQDEIAADVVSSLRTELLGEVPTSRRPDPEAYDLFLRGRHLLEHDRGYAASEQARDVLRRAVDVDPDFARAWAELSRAYYRTVFAYRRDPDFAGDISMEEAWRLSDNAMDRALAAGPEDPMVLAYEAWGKFYEDSDWEAAAELYTRALELSPGNVEALKGAAVLARLSGNEEVGIRLQEAAVARDPTCQTCKRGLADAYADAGRFADAERILLGLRDAGLNVDEAMAHLLVETGKPAAALVLTEESTEIPETNRLTTRSKALAKLGRTAEAREAIARLIDKYGQDAELDIAGAYADIGDRDDSLEWLQRAVNKPGGPRRLQVNFSHWIRQYGEQYAGDPRWIAIAEQIGRSPTDPKVIDFDPPVPD